MSEERTPPLWLDSLLRFWPVLVTGIGLTWAAIMRDINQENRLTELDKFGSTAVRQQVKEQGEVNLRVLTALTEITSQLKDQNRRITRLEERK